MRDVDYLAISEEAWSPYLSTAKHRLVRISPLDTVMTRQRHPTQTREEAVTITLLSSRFF